MAGFGLSESVLQFRQSAVFSQSTVFEKKGEREADQEDACDDTRSTGEVQGPSGWIHAQAESGRVAMPGCAGDSETQECALGGQDCDGQAERCGVAEAGGRKEKGGAQEKDEPGLDESTCGRRQVHGGARVQVLLV